MLGSQTKKLSITAATYRECLIIKKIENEKYMERYYRRQLRKFIEDTGKISNDRNEDSQELESQSLSQSCESHENFQRKDSNKNYMALQR